MSEPLKPCPFDCGGTVEGYEFTGHPPIKSMVEHQPGEDCPLATRAYMPERVVPFRTSVAAWNRRADPLTPEERRFMEAAREYVGTNQKGGGDVNSLEDATAWLRLLKAWRALVASEEMARKEPKG